MWVYKLGMCNDQHAKQVLLSVYLCDIVVQSLEFCQPAQKVADGEGEVKTMIRKTENRLKWKFRVCKLISDRAKSSSANA